MIKNTKYIDIEYTTQDDEYIDDLAIFINNNSKEIIEFFGINNFGEKVTLKLFNNLEEFRNACSNRWKNGCVPDWLCGLSFHDNEKCIIYTLCLSEYKKTKGHNNHSVKDLKHLIMHEFVHACHQKYIDFIKPSIKLPIWTKEGLATTLSHQYDDFELTFESTLEEMINGGTSYKNYYAMFLYVLNRYGKNYILNLLKNNEELIKVTPKLFEEVNEYYNK